MPSLPSAFGPAVVGATVVVVIPTDAICVMRARRGPSYNKKNRDGTKSKI